MDQADDNNRADLVPAGMPVSGHEAFWRHTGQCCRLHWGSYLGSALGGGTAARIVGAVAGGVAGYYVGSTVGGYLGKEDKQRMAQASQTAFDTGQPQTFSNLDTGLKGTAQVLPSPPTAQQDGECKTIRQTVVLKDGKTVTEDVRSCKEPG